MKRYSLILLSLFFSSPVLAFETLGFANPYEAVVDQKTGMIYVSNINGDASAKDDNGFISRLQPNGQIDKLHFLDGAEAHISLNAPKGLTIWGEQLCVADLTNVRCFDVQTGKNQPSIDLSKFEIKHLYDVFAGPDNMLYVVDGDANVIYRVDEKRKAAVFVEGAQLGQPHAITWDPVKERFVVAGWGSGSLTAFDRSGKQQALPSVFVRTIEGLASDVFGNLYLSSYSLRSVYKFGNDGSLNSLLLNQDGAAGLSFDAREAQLIFTQMNTGKVGSYSLQK